MPITQTTSETNISTAQAQVDTAEAAVALRRARCGRGGGTRSAKPKRKSARRRPTAPKRKPTWNAIRRWWPRTKFRARNSTRLWRAAKAQSAAVDSAHAAVEANRAAAESSARMVDQRKSQLAEARSRLAQSNRNAPQQMAISRATLRSKEAQAAAAKAGVDRALLDISYTRIVAPVAGVVGKRSVEMGATVQPGQQLFTIAQIGDLWVTANFKETQLRRMRPGLRVDIKVDAFGQKFGGYVESMPGASGSITSLLPPENATGNFVKVVQRLPVRIRFDKNQAGPRPVAARACRWNPKSGCSKWSRTPSGSRNTIPWAVALTVTMATFMEVLDTSIANVSLPHIAGNLSVSEEEATWVLTSYLVSNAIILPISAWFSRLIGRKRFYMTCVALFTCSSFLCGLAPSLGRVGGVPRAARRGRRRVAAQRAIDSGRYVSSGEARHGIRGLWNGGGGGAGHRPYAGRLDHR